MAIVDSLIATVKDLRILHHRALAGEASREELSEWHCIATVVLDGIKEQLTLTQSIVNKRKLEAALVHLESIHHKLSNCLRQNDDLQETRNRVIWSDIQSAFNNRIRTGVITNLCHVDVKSFFQDAQTLFTEQIRESINIYKSLKVYTTLAAEFKILTRDEEKIDLKHFHSKSVCIFFTTDLKEWFITNVQNKIMRDMEELEWQNSGWTLIGVLNLSINICKLSPLSGSSFIELPPFIQSKKACINVKNNDQQCFKWAILSCLHPVDNHSHRVCKYKDYSDELNFNGIEFPVNPKSIPKFEKQNNISINLYVLARKKNKQNDTYEVLPCHVSAAKIDGRHCNLLLLQDHYEYENESECDDDDDMRVEEELGLSDVKTIRDNLKYHYVWIKNLSRLVSSQQTKHNGRFHLCDRCLHYFFSCEKLKEHEKDCSKLNTGKIILPPIGKNILQFENFAFQEKVPFVVYADFECLLKPVINDAHVMQEHKPISVGYYIHCNYDDTLSRYRSYRQLEEDDMCPAEWFVMEMNTVALKIQTIHDNPKEMNLSADEETMFQMTRFCHICKERINDNSKKVRDHCHLTGKFRGAAHNECNVNYTDSRVLPVFFHNLRGYDSHLFIKEISTLIDGRVSLLPINKEQYISFTKHIRGCDMSIRFLDTFRFMGLPLSMLADYLSEHKIMEKVLKKFGYNERKIQLLKRKGVFPYEYLTSHECLKEKELPPKEKFYSSLTGNHISDEDYAHAQDVWKEFNCPNLGDYLDIYLLVDILLLADVKEHFRDDSMKRYGLDSAHYFTTPGLSWDAMLKMTKIKLELITDMDILLFIRRGIRGGISQCSNRYAAANNPYMKEGYNLNEEDKYIGYFDANNLYGWAMTQPLPYGGLKWVNDFDLNIRRIANDAEKGYILEVDLEYPQSIHDSHKDLPFCAEHVCAPGSMYTKLMLTLHNKNRYVIHYVALKQALSHGLRLKNVHRVLEFNQKPWLKEYIDLNSNFRAKATNEFEKMSAKLFNNAIYGKTMENELKRVNVKLLTKWHTRYGAKNYIVRPNFHSISVFDENLIAIQLRNLKTCIRKPIYIGLSVLDISKTLMYRFHYDFMRKQLGDFCKVLYTDTDSLVYEIRNFNMYELMCKHNDEFDTSDYSDSNKYGISRHNKKVVGKMKDECNGKIITEFVGLRSKMYAIKIQDQDTIKKAKGVKTSVVKQTISFIDYINCLHDNKTISREQCNIRSRGHNIRTEKQFKIALSAKDDKRYLQDGKTDTLPWGHYSIDDKAENQLETVGNVESVQQQQNTDVVKQFLAADENDEWISKATDMLVEGEASHSGRLPQGEGVLQPIVEKEEEGIPDWMLDACAHDIETKELQNMNESLIRSSNRLESRRVLLEHSSSLYSKEPPRKRRRSF